LLSTLIAICVAELQVEMEPTEAMLPFSLSHSVVGIARELDTG